MREGETRWTRGELALTEESPERFGSNAWMRLSDLAPSCAPYRCPFVRAPSLDHDPRQWGTRVRSDWRSRVGAGGSGRERVASRETRFRIGAQTAENRAPCRVASEFRYRDSIPIQFGSSPNPLIGAEGDRTRGTRRWSSTIVTSNPRSRHVTVRASFQRSVTYSRSRVAESKGRREGQRRGGIGINVSLRSGDESPSCSFGLFRHPSVVTNLPLVRRRNRSSRRLALARFASRSSLFLRTSNLSCLYVTNTYRDRILSGLLSSRLVRFAKDEVTFGIERKEGNDAVCLHVCARARALEECWRRGGGGGEGGKRSTERLWSVCIFESSSRQSKCASRVIPTRVHRLILTAPREALKLDTSAAPSSRS